MPFHTIVNQPWYVAVITAAGDILDAHKGPIAVLFVGLAIAAYHTYCEPIPFEKLAFWRPYLFSRKKQAVQQEIAAQRREQLGAVVRMSDRKRVG